VGGTALVLSGGGARGSFQMGAIQYLYKERGLDPNLIVGSSVGAIHAAKLAEVRTGERSEQLRVVNELTSVWTSRMRRNEDMYDWAPWIVGKLDADSRMKLRSLMSAGGFDRLWANLQPDVLSMLVQMAAMGPMPTLGLRALGYFDDVKFLLELADALFGTHGSSVFTLAPLQALMASGILNPAKVRAGTDLRLAVVSLDDGSLRWTDGQGRLRSEEDELIPDLLENSLINCVLASAAMPIAFPPVVLSDRHSYTDGGVREVVPTALMRQRRPDEIYTVICSPRAQPMPAHANPGPGAWTLGDVAARMLDLLLDEVVAGDLAAAGLHPTHHVIVPDVNVHDTTEIDPGLIDINILYGFLAADDVLANTAPENRAQLRPITNAITQLKVFSRHLELAFTRSALNEDADKHHIDVVRWLIRELFEKRTELGGIAPDPSWYQGPTRMPVDERAVPVSGWLWNKEHWSPNLFLREDSGQIWAVVGGAPFAMHTMKDYNALKPFMPDPNPLAIPDGGAPQYLRRVPARGHFIKESGADPIYYSDGTMLWHVPNPMVLTAMGGGTSTAKPIRPVPAGALNGLPMSNVPVNFFGPFTLTTQALGQPTPDAHVVSSPIGETRDGVLILRSDVTGTLTVKDVRIEDPSGVLTIAGTYAGKRVAAKEQLGIFITYKPTRARSTMGVDQRATVVVETDYARQPSQSFIIVATPGAETPRAAVSIADRTRWLSFGKVSVATTAVGTLTLRNSGTRDAQIASIEITGAAADQFAAPYTWPVIGTGASVGLNFTCTPKPPPTRRPKSAFRLPLSPKDLRQFGERADIVATATITIQVRPGEMVTITRQLRATVGIATIVVPKSVAFPSVSPGGMTTGSLVIENSGNVDLVISSMSPTGPFSVSPTATFPFTVAGGGRRNLELRYYGQQSGTLNEDDCVIFSNDPVRPRVTVLCSGRTAGPDLVLVDNREMIDFGSVPVGQTVTGAIQLRNAGDAPTTIEKASVEPAAYGLATGTPVQVPSGATVSVEVTFTPTGLGPTGGQLWLHSSSQPEPIWVGLRGQGV
jgi:NTE family protein